MSDKWQLSDIAPTPATISRNAMFEKADSDRRMFGEFRSPVTTATCAPTGIHILMAS